MTQGRRRQMSRLEKLCAPVIDEVQRQDNAFKARLKDHATLHTISLGALILYGKPNVDEPLSNAWQRCSERFPNLQLERLKIFRGQIFAEIVAQIVRQAVMSDLPGSTEDEKFQNLFSSAPPWLIWFTFADFTAELLGLTLPDLSSVKKFARSKAVIDNWPAVPDGKFALRRRRDDFGDLDISVRDAEFFGDMCQIPEERMTRLERKRYLSIIDKLPPVTAIHKKTD
jgi:hypothetical protein